MIALRSVLVLQTLASARRYQISEKTPKTGNGEDQQQRTFPGQSLFTNTFSSPPGRRPRKTTPGESLFAPGSIAGSPHGRGPRRSIPGKSLFAPGSIAGGARAPAKTSAQAKVEQAKKMYARDFGSTDGGIYKPSYQWSMMVGVGFQDRIKLYNDRIKHLKTVDSTVEREKFRLQDSLNHLNAIIKVMQEGVSPSDSSSADLAFMQELVGYQQEATRLLNE